MLQTMNLTIWKYLFQAFSPLSDHVGLAISLFAVMISIPFSYLSIKKAGVITDYIFLFPLLSVCHMLRNLGRIHPRISLMNKTVCDIIYASEKYQRLLYEMCGKQFSDKKGLSDRIMTFTKKQMTQMKDMEPQMLYEKLGGCFHSTRDFFGYLDQKPQHFFIYFIGLICLGILFILFFKNHHDSHLKRLILFQCILLLYAVLDRSGEVLFCVILFLSFYILRWFFVKVKKFSYYHRERKKGGRCR